MEGAEINIKEERDSPPLENTDVELSQKNEGEKSVLAQSSPTSTGKGKVVRNAIEICNEFRDDRPFKCPQCNKGFRQRGHLVYHLHTHSLTCEYKCEDCDEEFMTPARLLRHQRCVHKKNLGEEISQGFYIKGRGSKKTYTCKICGKDFMHSSSIRAHSWMHSGTRPFKCKHCNKGFRQSGHLICHVRESHSIGAKSQLCKICGEGFKTVNELTKHMKAHDSKESQKNQDNSGLQNEVKHDNVMSGGMKPTVYPSKVLASTRSNEKVATKPSMSTDNEENDDGNNMKNLRQSEVDAENDTEDSEHLSSWFITQNSCEVTSNSGDGIQTSQSLMYQLQDTVLVLPEDEANAFKEKDVNNNSLKSGIIKGDACDVDMEEKTEKDEVLTTHQAAGDLTFSYLPNLVNDKSHLLVKVVGNKKRFECTLCSKVFLHSQAAKNHSLVHSGAKPFRCNVCQQSFRQRAHVSYHMNVHMSGKRYLCRYCDSKYGTTTKLRRHARKVHGLNEEQIKKMLAPQKGLFKFRQKNIVNGTSSNRQDGIDTVTKRMCSSSSEGSVQDSQDAENGLHVVSCVEGGQAATDQSPRNSTLPQILFVESKAKMKSSDLHATLIDYNGKRHASMARLGVDDFDVDRDDGVAHMEQGQKDAKMKKNNSIVLSTNGSTLCHSSTDHIDLPSNQVCSSPWAGNEVGLKNSEHCLMVNVMKSNSKKTIHDTNVTSENWRQQVNHIDPRPQQTHEKEEQPGISLTNGKTGVESQRSISNRCSQGGTHIQDTAKSRRICKACCEELGSLNPEEARCIVCGVDIAFEGGVQGPEKERVSVDLEATQIGIFKRETHRTEKLYPCPFCTKIFRRKTDAESHLRFHSKPLSFCCTLCDNNFYRMEDFRSHANQHIMHSGDKTRKEASSFADSIVNCMELVTIEGCEFEVHVKERGEDFYCQNCEEDFRHWLQAKEHAAKHKKN